MTMTERPLPARFLFGASTSAHQTEGGNVNSDFWALEHAGTSAMAAHIREPSGDACDSYHRWREDMELLAERGFNAYRFGIEWARVEPEPGLVSHAQLLRYRSMVETAVELGLEPVVTLHHFTSPRWLTALGGVHAQEAADRFVRYVEALAPVLDGGVRHVVTINEPNMLAMVHGSRHRDPDGEADGPLPPVHQPTADALVRMHRAAYDAIHRRHGGIAVGWSVANQCVEALPGGEALADAYRESREDRFLRISADDDFVGVQTYTRTRFGPEGAIAPTEPLTLMGWEVYPQALEASVRHAADVVGDVPVLVTEHGIATDDDDLRIRFTERALAGLSDALDDGIDVRGYLHWSALDNYEWGSFAPTFGLVAVDRKTFARTPKPSAAWLGDLGRRRVLPARPGSGRQLSPTLPTTTVR